MLKLIGRFASFAALLAVALLGASVPSYASGHPELIGAGVGVGGPTPFGSQPAVRLGFVMLKLPGSLPGQAVGAGQFSVPNSVVTFRLDSYAYIGTALVASGPVISVQNPLGIPNPFNVGDTMFFVLNDDGNNCANPDTWLEGNFPPGFLGDLNGDGVSDSASDIAFAFVNFFGGLPPDDGPASAWRHVCPGNYVVHSPIAPIF